MTIYNLLLETEGSESEVTVSISQQPSSYRICLEKYKLWGKSPQLYLKKIPQINNYKLYSPDDCVPNQIYRDGKERNYIEVKK